MITFEAALEIAKEFNPKDHPRDPRDGRFTDKLGLVGRIPLDEGSVFLGSTKVDVGEENDIRLAIVRRSDGRTELRMDVGWDDPERADPPTREDFDDEGDDGESSYQRAMAEHTGRWRGARSDTTARAEIEHVINELKAVEELRRMASKESDELMEEIWPDGAAEPPIGVTWPKGATGWQYDSPETAAKWKSLMDRNNELSEGGDVYSGVIEGEWADIHWAVVGNDTEGTPGKRDWATTRLMTRPHANRNIEYSALYEEYDELNRIELTAKGSAKLLRELEKMRAAAGGT